MKTRPENTVEFKMLGQDVWVHWPDLDLKMKLGPKHVLVDQMCRFAAAVDIGECGGPSSADFN